MRGMPIVKVICVMLGVRGWLVGLLVHVRAQRSPAGAACVRGPMDDGPRGFVCVIGSRIELSTTQKALFPARAAL